MGYRFSILLFSPISVLNETQGRVPIFRIIVPHSAWVFDPAENRPKVFTRTGEAIHVLSTQSAARLGFEVSLTSLNI
jgi:hypothetical protein